ncbi:MAG: EcsC family protein [Turicibacter sp.]|nr:EcsC family protein [Turicibacter sp.]
MNEDNLYFKSISRELAVWEAKMLKPPGAYSRISKDAQSRFSSLMPKKVQRVITLAMKSFIETVLGASSFFTSTLPAQNPTLAEGDFMVEKAYGNYHKTAIVQGVGFGMGGLLINLADLPALLSIKVKFLVDCCKLYGFDVDNKSERIYMLYVFQLAFCSEERRLELYPIIKNWDHAPHDADLDWEKLQLEYRDYLDFAKMLQFLPVVGAFAGGAANHSLMNKLKVTAMNCYRMRLMAKGA